MREEYRKTAHIFFGIIIALFIYFADRITAIAVLGIVILLSLCIAAAIYKGKYIPLFSPIVAGLEREGVFPGKGTILFFVGTFVCLLLFEKDYVVSAVLVLSFLDGISTIVGINFGKTKIYRNKSLEGSLSGIICGFLALFLLMSVPAPAAAITAAVAGITELFSPVDDNLTIPIAVCITLTLSSTLVTSNLTVVFNDSFFFY